MVHRVVGICDPLRQLWRTSKSSTYLWIGPIFRIKNEVETLQRVESRVEGPSLSTYAFFSSFVISRSWVSFVMPDNS